MHINSEFKRLGTPRVLSMYILAQLQNYKQSKQAAILWNSKLNHDGGKIVTILELKKPIESEGKKKKKLNFHRGNVNVNLFENVGKCYHDDVIFMVSERDSRIKSTQTRKGDYVFLHACYVTITTNTTS